VDVPSRYLKKVRAVYPNLSLDHLELNRDGLINDVVIVDGKLVCRFPRTEWAKNILAHEARVLDVWDPCPHLRL
jgi:aminoglycoside 2''-phosphotransferase